MDILGCRTRNKKVHSRHLKIYSITILIRFQKEYLVNWIHKLSWIPSKDVTEQLKKEFKNKTKAGPILHSKNK